MIIGIDLDNTLVSYDRVFREVALGRGIPLPAAADHKEQIRDFIREQGGGDVEWQRLQAIVYGPRVREATLIDGVPAFLEACTQRRVPVFIVSHKTETAPYADEPVNLRDAALGWMAAHRFFARDGLGLSRDRVLFASTRREKVETIARLGCTHFIDDLPEVLLDPGFPPRAARLLLAPGAASLVGPPVETFHCWDDIREHLFGV